MQKLRLRWRTARPRDTNTLRKFDFQSSISAFKINPNETGAESKQLRNIWNPYFHVHAKRDRRGESIFWKSYKRIFLCTRLNVYCQRVKIRLLDPLAKRSNSTPSISLTSMET